MNPHIQPSTKDHRDMLAKMEENMLLFGKVSLPNLFTVKSPPFHYELSRDLSDRSIRKLNIIAPRGHAKSSIGACVLPLHHIFFDEGPKVIILCSKTMAHAQRLLQTIKNALDYSIPLRSLVGYWGEHSAVKWTESEIVLKDNTLIVARGTGQQVVGLKHGDQRPTLIVLDDPEDMNNTKTAEAMEFNLRWLMQSLGPSLDPLRGRMVVIGTPQHERCMVFVLREMEGWKTLFYDAIINEKTEEVLWPEWWSYNRLMEEKAAAESVGRVASFYREFRCQVIGDEDQLFRESYLRYYDGHLEVTPAGKMLVLSRRDGLELSGPKKIPVNTFTGVDPASTTNQTSDYSTIVTIAIDADKNRYVLPYYRKRVTPLKLADAMLHHHRLYDPDRMRVETVGYQDMLREYVKEQRYIPGLELRNNPRNSKSNRLEALEPFFSQGKVYIQKNMQELVDELLMYPRGKHDDLLDGLYYACKSNYPPSAISHEAIREEDDDWDIPEEYDWLLA